IFVFTLDTAASLGWYHSFGGSKADRPFGASLDASGNIYITGDFRDTIDFDPGPNEELRIAAGCDIYILKLDSIGNYHWIYTAGAEATDFGNDVAVDRHGTVYATGSFGGNAFEPAPVSPTDFDHSPGVANL